MTDDDRIDIPPLIEALERALSVAILVRDLEPGPPAVIEAAGMVDGDSTLFRAHGPTEADAWRDLAEQVATWRNVDPRMVRTVLGGG
jgi:hypothetical protein